VKPAADAKGVRLEAHVDPDLPSIQGDPQRLQQILWNLLSNAVKFNEPGGEASLLVARDGRSLRITVSDSGVGIAPAMLPFVFDRFTQADPSSTRLHAGLGLGLAIVRHIVELHGGTVAAESPGEGRGATFRVRLPVSVVERAHDRQS
jgi:signal transduction histidine kinase